MADPNEPPLKKLKCMERDLFRADSTDENMRKLKAIGRCPNLTLI